jgi:UDP-N-acetylmuramyl pentapeptide phosphotransferase/UDP-N-acetylglucosamine-1-phosphate transferase
MKAFVLTCLAISVASMALTYLARSFLLRRAILDLPNARSSHTAPTPRGGGWGLMLALLPAWIWSTARAGRLDDPAEILLILGAAGLMAVSWIDDRRGLGPAPRFAAQTIAVALVMAALPHDLSLSGGFLPLPLDRIVGGLVWLWFVNLFNFMDGIDGIAGGSAAAMGIGIMLVSMLHGPHELQAFRGAAIAAASVGFLIWNWQPAKIFLGDVGSVPLGYLLGFELVQLAMDAGQIAALIIASYYLADATITLLRRAARRERIWQAHREHFYQQAVSAGRSHAQVAAAAVLVQLMLALLAAASAAGGRWLMIFPAAILVTLLMLWMTRPAKGATA